MSFLDCSAQWLRNKERVYSKISQPSQNIGVSQIVFYHAIVFSPREDPFLLLTMEDLPLVNEVLSGGIMDSFL